LRNKSPQSAPCLIAVCTGEYPQLASHHATLAINTARSQMSRETTGGRPRGHVRPVRRSSGSLVVKRDISPRSPARRYGVNCPKGHYLGGFPRLFDRYTAKSL
jgi:hypothetical protein